MWYFLERPDLVSKLVRKGIPATEHTVTKPKNANGVIFQGSYLKEVLEVLGLNLDDIKTRETKTDAKNITLLELEVLSERKIKREFQEEKAKFNADKEKLRERYVAMLKNLISSLRRSGSDDSSDLFEKVRQLKEAHIEVERFYGAKSFAEEFDRLWKMPEVKKINITHRYLKATLRIGFMMKYRIKIPLDRNIYHITIYRGLFSFRPKWVARLGHEFSGGRQVCFGDMENQVQKVLNRREFVTLLKFIIEFIRAGVKTERDDNYDPEERMEIWRPKKIILDPIRLIRKKMSFLSKQKYIDLMEEVTKQNRMSAQQRLENLQSDVNEAKESLLGFSRHQKFSKTTKEETKKLEDKWLRDFSEIISNEKIDLIKVEDSEIEIFTKPLKIRTRDGSIDIGGFRISIDLRKGSIGIQNIGNKKGNYDHPLVMNGFPYFDADLWISLTKLLARLDVPTTVNAILEYLENPQDTLVSPDRWKN